MDFSLSFSDDYYQSEFGDTVRRYRRTTHDIPQNSTFLSSESDEETIRQFFKGDFWETEYIYPSPSWHGSNDEGQDQVAPSPTKEINISYLSTTSSDLFSESAHSLRLDPSSVRTFLRFEVPPSEVQIYEVPPEQRRRGVQDDELGEPLSESRVLEIMNSSLQSKTSILHHSDMWVNTSYSSSAESEGAEDSSFRINFDELVQVFENSGPSEQRGPREVPVNHKCVAALIRAFEEKNK